MSDQWVPVAMEEYKTLRQESLSAIEQMQRTLQIGLVAIGVLTGFGVDAVKEGTGVQVGLAISTPLVAALVVVLRLDELYRTVNAGAHIAVLERKIARKLGDDEPPLTWESDIQKDFDPEEDRFRHGVITGILFAAASAPAVVLGTCRAGGGSGLGMGAGRDCGGVDRRAHVAVPALRAQAGCEAPRSCRVGSGRGAHHAHPRAGVALLGEGALGARLQADSARAPLAAGRLHPLVCLILTRGKNQTVPVLLMDGEGIGDSTEIIRRLEERFPEPPLYPADPDERQRALELEDLLDEESAATSGGWSTTTSRAIPERLTELAAEHQVQYGLDVLIGDEQA